MNRKGKVYDRNHTQNNITLYTSYKKFAKENEMRKIIKKKYIIVEKHASNRTEKVNKRLINLEKGQRKCAYPSWIMYKFTSDKPKTKAKKKRNVCLIKKTV